MKKKIIIGSILVVVIVALVAVNILRNNGTIPAFGGGKAVSVKVKQLEKGSISSIVSASGVIEEINKSEIYFDTPMKIQKVLVEKNQKVKAGQKLIELDMDSMNSELSQLKITKAAQELALQKIISSDGTRSIASLEAALSVAKNSFDSAMRGLEDARKSLLNSVALFKAGAISEAELDRAKKAVTDAETGVKNAESNIRTSEDSLEESRKSNAQLTSGRNIDIETQRKSIEATSLRISDLEKKIKKILDNTVSPVDGVLVEENVEEGGFTSNMQPVFKIVDTDKLQIRADVKELNIKTVSIGQSVKISGDAINKDAVVTGKVSAISPVAKKNKTSSGDETLVEVVVSIDKASPVLKPGLSVTCDIITTERSDAILASFEMLKEDKDGNKQVFVYDEKTGIIHEKTIKLGIASDLDVEVIEGLSAGDQVVLNPLPTYKDGAKARIAGEEKK